MFTVPDFLSAKGAGRQIALLACYDAPTARIVEAAGIDAVLVGDSVAMVIHGRRSTTDATLEMLCAHTAAVRSGSSDLFIIADMPFMTTRSGVSAGAEAAASLIRAGANAVKIEGADGHGELIPALTGGGIPVMGHLGLQPQSINLLGRYARQGKTAEQADKLKRDALQLEELGCFAMVMECVSPRLANELCPELGIPAIGIGSGDGWNGQILVAHDLFGLNPSGAPSFAKPYAQGFGLFEAAASAWIADVRNAKRGGAV